LGIRTPSLVKNAVITGLGITSPLGANKQEVVNSLHNGTSGITFQQEFKDKDLKSHIAGIPKIDSTIEIPRQYLRFMSEASQHGYIATLEALEDAGLTQAEIQDPRIGVVAGSGGISMLTHTETVRTLEEKGLRRVSPFNTPRIMSNSLSANLATAFQIKGLNYSITSACSTSAHCIGHAAEQIQLGNQDIIIAGGAEEANWTLVLYFDAMRATSTKYNDSPETASRPYDTDRDGLIIAGGAGIVIVEEEEHAKKRGAKIYAKIVGYAANSDGAEMTKPSGEGATRCIKLAIQKLNIPIDYINTHGTSTPAGDITELHAIREALGADLPHIASTKSLTGHSLGAAGAHEAIYTLLMMKNDFIAASANIQTLDPQAQDYPIIQQTLQDTKINTALTNSFGFGGTNACLVFQK
jgi:3-oxoacyl-[acyl-carrier-protein] synthase I